MDAHRTFHPLTVATVEPLCDDAVAITFAVPSELADAYAFEAGQSLTLRRVVDGAEQRRSYSICAPPGAPPRIGVREVPGGLISPWLVRHVRPGDAVEVQPPRGSFTPDTALAGHHVMIAGGSGITPVLSIVASVLTDPASHVSLFYGNRRAATVMFADELADLKDRAPERLELVHVLSREPRESELLTGRLDAAKLRVLVPAMVDVAGIAQWWLCGPYGMVVDAERVLGELGVPAERVHRELFYVEDAAPTPSATPAPSAAALGTETSEVTIVLDGRRSTITLPRDAAILAGVQRERPDLPYSCKGGVCGTCRARLVHGDVDLRRNFALTSHDLEAGFVLTCQSYPKSESVTLDYDT